jgi:hypothetical protein
MTGFQRPGQPRILDGDRRLVGERLQQGNLLRAERLHTRSPDHDTAEGDAVIQERNGKDGSDAFDSQLKSCEPAEPPASDHDVGHVNRPPIEHGSPERGITTNGMRVAETLRLCDRPILRHEAMLIAVEQIDESVAGIAQLRSRSRDRAEHGAKIGRRQGPGTHGRYSMTPLRAVMGRADGASVAAGRRPVKAVVSSPTT